MKVSGYDGNKVILEVVDDNVVGDPKKNDEIGLWFFF